MAALGPVINMYQNLVREWTKKPVNLDNVGSHLTKMKVSTFNFFYNSLKQSGLFFVAEIIMVKIKNL